MYIHKEAKGLFLCHPRTASRATADLLRRHGFVNWMETKGPLPFKVAGSGSRHHERLATRPPPEWTVACTVRHHFEVVTSWLFALRLYRAKTLERRAEMLAALDMETFLGKLPAPEIIGARSIPRTYYPNANELLPNVRFANCIVMYQHLGSDITEFLTRCGILRNQDPLKRLSTSVNDVPSAPCEEILTPAMMDVICKRYRQEMEDWSFLVDGKAVGYGNLTRGDSGA